MLLRSIRRESDSPIFSIADRRSAVVLLLWCVLFLAASAQAQKSPAANAPRPLDALGMPYAKLMPYLEPCKSECRQHEKEAKIGNRVTFEFSPYAYTVEGGKVVEVMITAASFEDFVAEGKEKWGPPTSLVYQAVPNPDGPDSNNGQARWDLPGGVVVDARQSPVPGRVVDVTKLQLGGKTVMLTQKEPATQGALVFISNPSAQHSEKPKPRPLL
jgi:hypothetical protein